SGTNDFHGSGFYQTRPVWGQSENFFNAVAGVTKEESGLADAYYRLFGGGFGGPIVKNRTFFWTATEGYRSGTTRNQQEIWPTETINGPMQQNEDGNTNANGTAFVVDKAIMWTFKAEHKFTDKSSLSGLYIYNKTDEPGSTIMKADKLFMADQDQWFGPLRRRPHVLVFNNTAVLSNTTVLTLRYGWTTWQDSCDSQPFTAGLQSLGFSPTFVNALPPGGSNTFPSLGFDGGTEFVGGWGPGPVRWKAPYAINGALTKLMGNHSVKVGADLRR